MATGRMLASLLTFIGLLCCCCALRNVMLVMPPVVRTGGTVTLKCLYDLDGDKLYAVKWYRGNFEFYRATPHENPPKQAFSYPDFHVDLSQSDDHQVTLRRVPPHMSGIFACEVSSDAPSFSTFVKKGELRVLETDRRPVLTVSKNVYRSGDELEANCTMPSGAIAEPLPDEEPHHRHHHARLQPLLPEQPPLLPHQLNAEQQRHLQREKDLPVSFAFWVNNKPVPASSLKQGLASATLRRPLAEGDFSEQGELRLKCVATLAGKYREPSHVVTVRRDDDEDEEDGVEEPPVVVTETHSAVNAIDAPLPDSADRSVGAPGSAGTVSVNSVVTVLMALVTAVLQIDNMRLRLVH